MAPRHPRRHQPSARHRAHVDRRSRARRQPTDPVADQAPGRQHCGRTAFRVEEEERRRSRAAEFQKARQVGLRCPPRLWVRRWRTYPRGCRSSAGGSAAEDGRGRAARPGAIGQPRRAPPQPLVRLAESAPRPSAAKPQPRWAHSDTSVVSAVSTTNRCPVCDGRPDNKSARGARATCRGGVRGGRPGGGVQRPLDRAGRVS